MSKHPNMTHNIAEMVVVASGTALLVQDWARLLRAASIQFASVDCLHEDGTERLDHTELWVGRDDVEEARSAIRKADAGDGPKLW